MKKILTNALALHIWCLATPPPRIIIPVLLAATAMLLILVISEIQCTPRVRTTVTTASMIYKNKCMKTPGYMFYPQWYPALSRHSHVRRGTTCLQWRHLSRQDWRWECCSEMRARDELSDSKKLNSLHTRYINHTYCLSLAKIIFLRRLCNSIWNWFKTPVTGDKGKNMGYIGSEMMIHSYVHS